MPQRFGSRSWTVGFALAVVALVSQLALGAMVLRDDQPANGIAALDAVSILCTGAKPPYHPGPAHHRHGDPAVCPISIALTLPSVVLGSAPALLPRSGAILVFRDWGHPPGRGPPPSTARVGEPRGPPVTA